MKCEICGNDEGYVVQKNHDYTALAGLTSPRITLVNIRVYVCPDCGAMPEIPCIEGVHQAIGVGLVTTPEPLQPEHIRYLRKYLGMTQKEFATLIEVSDDTIVSRFETGKETPSRTRDHFIRATFVAELERFKEKGELYVEIPEDLKLIAAMVRLRPASTTIISELAAAIDLIPYREPTPLLGYPADLTDGFEVSRWSIRQLFEQRERAWA